MKKDISYKSIVFLSLSTAYIIACIKARNIIEVLIVSIFFLSLSFIANSLCDKHQKKVRRRNEETLDKALKRKIQEQKFQNEQQEFELELSHKRAKNKLYLQALKQQLNNDPGSVLTHFRKQDSHSNLHITEIPNNESRTYTHKK